MPLFSPNTTKNIYIFSYTVLISSLWPIKKRHRLQNYVKYVFSLFQIPPDKKAMNSSSQETFGETEPKKKTNSSLVTM